MEALNRMRAGGRALAGDLVHAWRAIGRMPVLSAVIVVSLGIGIGVNTAVFSWIELVVLQPLPGVRDGGSFDLVEARGDSGSYPGLSWPEYRELRARLPAFEELLAFRMVPFNVGEASHPERTYGLLVSGNFFSGLGVTPSAGRTWTAEEAEEAAGRPVAVVSHRFWRTRLGGDPGALGRVLRVNDREVTVIGVAPPRFQGTVLGLDFDLFVPAASAPALLGSNELEDRGLRGYSAMGRRRPGETRAAAQAQLDAAMADFTRAYPETSAWVRGEVLPFWSAPRGPQRMLARALAVLQAVMLVLLLAVCGNTASLVLARASVRQREVGVRLALGAGPGRVASLLLTESLLLSLLATVVGAVLAAWGTEALRAVPLTGAFPIRLQTRVDGPVLAFAGALGVACAALFGAAPAWQLARMDPYSALRTGMGAAPGRSRLRHALMGAEVALATMVLLAAGLFLQGFRQAHGTSPGFRREGVLLAAYDLSGRDADDARARAFTSRLLSGLRALPAVESAAVASSVPLDIHGLPPRAFALEGRARTSSAPDRALVNTVTPGYFATMGIALRRGTDFADLDDAASPAQAIVNEEFVRRFLDGGEPIGRGLEASGRRYVIAGVVANSLYESFGEPAQPALFFSYRDRPRRTGEIHLRTRPGAEMLLAGEVRRIVRGLDPSLPVYDVRTLDEHVEKNLFLRRIPARMFAVLGPLLLVLAAIGIYGVVSYAVAQRTREIGVRLALGATGGRVQAQIVGQTMRVVVNGAVLGWLLAFLVAIHLVRGPLPLEALAGVPALLALVSTAACWLPARRAASVDPVEALREE
jgi:macrolide transport system ATP-binding/permease protein